MYLYSFMYRVRKLLFAMSDESAASMVMCLPKLIFHIVRVVD